MMDLLTKSILNISQYLAILIKQDLNERVVFGSS